MHKTECERCEDSAPTLENELRLNRDHERSLIVWKGLSGFLILGPEPRRDGFLDIGERFLFRLPLGEAARQSRALGYDPAIFVRCQNNMKHRDESSRMNLATVHQVYTATK